MVYDKEGIHDSIKRESHCAETKDTPTLTLYLDDLSDRSLRRVKQLGVVGVSIGSLKTGDLETWTDNILKEHIERVNQADVQLRNVMFNPSDRIRFGKPGRDEDLEIIIKAIEENI